MALDNDDPYRRIGFGVPPAEVCMLPPDPRRSGEGAGIHWFPGSWRRNLALQQPAYPDEAALATAEREPAAYSPLAAPAEMDALRDRLAEVQAGRARGSHRFA